MSEIIHENILYTLITERSREVRAGNNTNIHRNAVRGEINPILRFPSHIYDQGVTYKVTRIGQSAFYSCTEIVSVVFPNTIQELESCCFSDCPNMSAIEFLPGSQIKSIGVQVFCRSYRVKVIILPESLKTLSKWAFVLMTDLKLVVYPGKHVFNSDVFGDGAYGNDSLQSRNVTILVPNNYKGDKIGTRNVTQSYDVRPQIRQTCRISPHAFNKQISLLLFILYYK